MSLDKSIQHGKEKRKPYRKPKSVDKSCRNHGGCAHCENGRGHSDKRRAPDPAPRHVCGLSGFGVGRDGLNDVCPACEKGRGEPE